MWRVGQRVVSDLEPELGVGVITEIIGQRQLAVTFEKAEISRRYSFQTAPLQEASDHDGESSTGSDATFAPFSKNYWGTHRAFGLRKQAWAWRGLTFNTELRGLVGARVALLPHQLDISSRVAHRAFPRVLLADEVGLGKTIEAGLIFSSLRALGRANHVLILVPDGLEHQWLAEMYRRFGEMFSLIDEDRSQAEDDSQGQSAFQMNQRIICSMSFLESSTERLMQAAEEEWDLIIIDEAHRLRWNQTEPSIAWDIARLLSERTRGLLLLTATPERQGLETEFGLLQLVDPEKFSSYDSFAAENKAMRQNAELASLVQKGDRSQKTITALQKRFEKDAGLRSEIENYAKGNSEGSLLEQLIDRHGTGRVFIRNRRSRLKGFPERQLKPLPLALPALWESSLKEIPVEEGGDEEEIFLLAAGIEQITGGKGAREWLEVRADAVLSLLNSIGNDKALLICSSVERVEDLQERFRKQSTIRTAIFHEEMEIVERDRQAAWFADPEGARVLLCSEIGGEGRNFQFCHHLILFDLPLHPDSLEQRIGRLDRIGQKEKIQIHVPYFLDTPEEALARWYSEGLEAFTVPSNGGDTSVSLRNQMLGTFRSFLPSSSQYSERKKLLSGLLETTKKLATKAREDQAASVDILIDLNSFDEGRGRKLAKQIAARDHDTKLFDFMESVLDYFHVESEQLDSLGTHKYNLHSLSLVDSFPGFEGAGEMLGTYHRDHALRREELAFFSLEHPLVQGALTLLLEGDTGRVTIGKRRKTGVPCVEFLYVLQPTAPAFLEVERDFPLQTFSFVLSLDGKLFPNLTASDTEGIENVSQRQCQEFASQNRKKLDALYTKAREHAAELAAPLIAPALQERRARYQAELTRLEALSKINPLITEEEIEAYRADAEEGLAAIQAITPRLDAVSVIL